MGVRQINANEATVKTATVEVRMLTIDGKQVTLAVFRQLIETPLMDGLDDETNMPILAGTAWGTVNYHPDKCGDSARRHVHVVWQQGDQLRRSRVNHELPEWSSNWGEQIDDTRYLAILRRIVETDGDGKVSKAPYGLYRRTVESGNVRIVVDDDQRGADATRLIGTFKQGSYEGWKYSDSRHGQWYSDPAEMRRAVIESAEGMVGVEVRGLDSGATLAYAVRDFGALAAARARYRALYDEIEALDQLFIAV